MKNNDIINNLILENAALKAELAEAQQKLAWLIEQLTSSRRRLYGPSSEKSVYDGIQTQTEIFDDIQPPIVVMGGGSPLAGEPQPNKNKPIKRGEMSTRLPEGLPVETIECELPEGQQECPECGEQMQPIGKEIARREIKVIPAQVTIIEYSRIAYICNNCAETNDTAPIVKAPIPPPVIKGSMCTPETAAHIIVQKFVMGSPLYRLEKDFNRSGIPIKRQTMANWLIRCSEGYFEPVYDELHLLLCQKEIVHSDDTPFQVLREPGKPAQSDSRMWLYRTSCDAKFPIVLYDYQPDKRKERPRDFLAGFSGYLLTDGCSSYHSLPDNIIVVGCFQHVRSKFSDALKCLKVEDRPGSLALIGKEYCNRIFDIDREAKDCTFDERFDMRNKKAVPVLDEFHAWLESVKPYVSSKSKLGVAVGYALNQWKYLTNYLLDGRLECNNSRSERSIKPFVINRKNFLFATSVAGARAAAVLQSLTETAIENGLNPFEYLTYVLRTAAAGNIRNDADLLDKLLPHNAPEFCRALKQK